MGWASSCKLKGGRFDSQSGHKPGLGACERQLIDVSLPLSPSFLFSLKINKIFKKIETLGNTVIKVVSYKKALTLVVFLNIFKS